MGYKYRSFLFSKTIHVPRERVCRRIYPSDPAGLVHLYCDILAAINEQIFLRGSLGHALQARLLARCWCHQCGLLDLGFPSSFLRLGYCSLIHYRILIRSSSYYILHCRWRQSNSKVARQKFCIQRTCCFREQKESYIKGKRILISC